MIEHPIVPTGCMLTPAAAVLLLLNKTNVTFVSRIPHEALTVPMFCDKGTAGSGVCSCTRDSLPCPPSAWAHCVDWGSTDSTPPQQTDLACSWPVHNTFPKKISSLPGDQKSKHNPSPFVLVFAYI